MSRAAGRHYGSVDVALELRSNVEVDCQGVPGRYILHRVDYRTKVDKRKALIRVLVVAYDVMRGRCPHDEYPDDCG
jgi:hypothetical protein